MIPSQETLKQLLDYDPDTGVLTWKERSPSYFKSPNSHAAWNTRFSGARAGWSTCHNLNGRKARCISLLGKDYHEHRVVWVWMTGDQPPEQIDHIDRNPENNAWRNLQASNNAHNMKNKTMYKRNTSGFTGVYWHSRDLIWEAKCRLDGKLINIGRYSCKYEAADAVSKFRRENGFSEGHGTPSAT